MFTLFISETKLARVPGLSAAGANVDALPYTAPADADMLFYDRPKVVDCVPLDPFGHPTPAIVTRAAILEGKFPARAVRVGNTVVPAAPFTDLSGVPGGDPRLGPSVSDWKQIKSGAEKFARETNDRLQVVAESVPGGTTTALLLLRSLGYEGTVSSAGPVNPLSLKEEIWDSVAARLGIGVGGLRGRGLEAAAEVGDPMQIAAASYVAALPENVEVVLAGGTQMLAVAALLRDLGVKRDILVATTKYVANDKTSCFERYAREIGVRTYAAPLDFSRSKYRGLSDYENGFIKEGVGMGGAVWYAVRNGSTVEKVIRRTEKLYESMVQD
jgi:uncharacterized protein (TIGR00303 family)